MKKMFLILITLLISVGCGTNVFEGIEDKNSTEAGDIENSKILDSGNYDSILDNPEDANATDYSAAAMGKAGLDPIKLINALNDIAQEGVQQNDLSAVVSLEINPDALNNVQTAKDKLKEELAANPTDPDLNFQLVMTSLTSTVTALSQVGQDNIDNFNPTDGIDPEEASLLGNYIADNPEATVNVDMDGDGENDKLLDIIAGDVNDTVDSLPNANLGNSDMNQVLTSTTQGDGSLDYDGDGIVTGTDISDYLINVLGQ